MSDCVSLFRASVLAEKRCELKNSIFWVAGIFEAVFFVGFATVVAASLDRVLSEDTELVSYLQLED